MADILFNEFQINTSVNNAQLGVSYIGEKVFVVDKLKLKNIKTLNLLILLKKLLEKDSYK